MLSTLGIRFGSINKRLIRSQKTLMAGGWVGGGSQGGGPRLGCVPPFISFHAFLTRRC